MFIECPRKGCDGEIEVTIDTDSQGDGVWAMAYYYEKDRERSCEKDHDLTAEEEVTIEALIDERLSDPNVLAGEFEPPYDDY